MTAPILIPLDRPAIHVDVAPGGEVILRGSFVSTRDGSTIDAATTSWPEDAPGGASIDAGGLLDLEGGGFHMTSRDAKTHEVHAIATGEAAPACDAAGVAAPCLPLRVMPQARTRLLTVSEWTESLKGAIQLEVPVTVLPPVAPSAVPYLAGAGAILLAALGFVLVRRSRAKRAASPMGKLLALADRVRNKLGTADPIVAAPLAPALERALQSLRDRKVDATSNEGRRVTEVLYRVEERIDDSKKRARAQQEQEAADALVQEMEDALAAAEEVQRASEHRP